MVFRRLFGRKPTPDLTAALETARVLGMSQALDAYQAAADFDTVHATAASGSSARTAYACHPLFTAAVNTMTSLVMGTGVAYGTMDDATAYEALEEWYALNRLNDSGTEMFRQWLLDGELLALLA